jgi:hypothetical protein
MHIYRLVEPPASSACYLDSSTAATQLLYRSKTWWQLQLLETFSTIHACVLCLQGLAFNSLPAVLANNTVLEQLDLSGNQVMGGVLPEQYLSWTNLTVFR